VTAPCLDGSNVVGLGAYAASMPMFAWAAAKAWGLRHFFFFYYLLAQNEARCRHTHRVGLGGPRLGRPCFPLLPFRPAFRTAMALGV
jgi:hypothetical protein